MLVDGGVPTSAAVPVAIVWLTFMGRLFHGALRCSTAADVKAMHARGIFRRRQLT